MSRHYDVWFREDTSQPWTRAIHTHDRRQARHVVRYFRKHGWLGYFTLGVCND